MGLDNDTRGWVMAAVSGIASIICVDLIIRQFPGKRNFKIEHSNHFLSSGLSLSFGVMIFSSLYSMLPSARSYLQKGGMKPKQASFALIGCFLIGALGISVLSRILHHYIPHSVVDCDHDHGDEEEGTKEPVDREPAGGYHDLVQNLPEDQQRTTLAFDGSGPEAERQPLVPGYGTINQHPQSRLSARRPSLQTQISTKVSQLVSGSKEFCDMHGQCFGYSDPCGQECFKIVQHARDVGSRTYPSRKPPTRPSGNRSVTMPHERLALPEEGAEYSALTPTQSDPPTVGNSLETQPLINSNGYSHPLRKQPSHHSLDSSVRSHDSHHHHHHVPTNVFLSIGLQTSIAIALHKLPEGFITYATNHANPSLGFSVFLALFVHNITEGFAMALPLYLAINSRWKAMFWSAILGGISQPLGAGIAALWFKIAGRKEGGEEPGETAYGAMFAITAGIMAMVGLQLFGESLELTHSRKLCFASAFVGMGILGLSSALTA
ncbi:Zinc/iron permease [Lindgomyces ingoldianus]|uniref:Zinc/iron permease n=1 Tax=Lindgomyces ingoldianus TaxID=673940 RepID=A0ACB6RFQ3_9PLEO|nr:Zinc/iron permease [Lindgomyces ingoldianus]KAF2477593.1 Zinc/iron permease [Lindgomyces ingoldianus]